MKRKRDWKARFSTASAHVSNGILFGVCCVRVIWRHAIWRLTIYITLKYHIIWSILKSSSQLTWFAKILLYYMGIFRRPFFFFFVNCHITIAVMMHDAWHCQLFKYTLTFVIRHIFNTYVPLKLISPWSASWYFSASFFPFHCFIFILFTSLGFAEIVTITIFTLSKKKN